MGGFTLGHGEKPAASDPSAPLRCSFCHKPEESVGKLISSPADYPRAYICDECIAVCHSILEDKRAAELADPPEAAAPELSPVMQDFAQFAKFSPDKMSKVTIAAGETLFVGLNCFEPLQQHEAHAHAGQDKLYVVLQGTADIQVGGERKIVQQGGGAFAPSGVMHSIRNVGETRLIVMAILCPTPARSRNLR